MTYEQKNPVRYCNSSGSAAQGFLNLFSLSTKHFKIISAAVVKRSQITAIAIPTDTLPFSNSMAVNVETVRTFGGKITPGQVLPTSLKKRLS